MFEVFKEFTFEAAHSLPHLPPEHKCHHLHGHSYRVTVRARSKELVDGMVIDYAYISDIWQILFRQLDHKFLNDVIEGSTTAENIAKWIYDGMNRLIPVFSVEVRETPTAGAIYRKC